MHAMRPKTDADDKRQIAKEIAIALIEKTGIQQWEDATQMNAIQRRSVECAEYIVEQFPQPRRD